MPHAALECHSAAPCAALRGIEVFLRQAKSGAWQLRYVLMGDVERLRVPEPRAPRAADRLWQHTCCEIFVARAGRAGYREFNFSPSGEWAAYEFRRYRDGGPLMVPDPGIRVQKDGARLELEAAVDLPAEKIRIGLAAVIEDADGKLSYWALRHAPGKPDFHHRDAFAMELDEARH